MNNLNELTTVTNRGTLTVAGTATETPYDSPDYLTGVTVSGTGLSSGPAALYADGTWARTNATLANGNNTFTAIANDTYGRWSTNSVTVNLPATNTYSYDLNGNLLSDGTRYFAYDDENQLISVTVSNVWRSEFVYDGLLRRRISREYRWNAGTSGWLKTNEVRYVYDGNLVIQERDQNNIPLVTYTRGNDLSRTLQGGGGIGGILARTDNAKLLISDPNAHAYYFYDVNGNVTELVNTNGLVMASYNYDPFGNMLSMSGPLASANTYRFSSKEWNEHAGLYYYGYRFYDPNLQRWLNRDPISEAGGINLYGFVFNNPFFWADQYGLAPWEPYPTCDAAAKGVMQDLHDHPETVNGEHYEKASGIFKDKDGKYYYNPPQNGTGLPGQSMPDFKYKRDKNDAVAGWAHDHIRGEDFSQQDKNFSADNNNIPGYVVTPKGDEKKYDPKTDKTTNIGHCN